MAGRLIQLNDYKMTFSVECARLKDISEIRRVRIQYMYEYILYHILKDIRKKLINTRTSTYPYDV